MDCPNCGAPAKEIAAKTTARGSDGITQCHRLECGHAWHLTRSTGGDPGVAPTPCRCGEIATVRELLVAGRRLAADQDAASDETFRDWAQHVLAALDGIPAEAGAPSLLRRATTAAKPSTGSLAKKVRDLNDLLVRAIIAVS